MAGIKKCGCYYYSHPHFDKVMSVSPLQIYIFFLNKKTAVCLLLFNNGGCHKPAFIIAHQKYNFFFNWKRKTAANPQTAHGKREA